jgi:hypothetical protein
VILLRDRTEVRVPPKDERNDDEVVDALDASHRQVAAAQRELFRLIVEGDRRELWRGTGARDMAHWLGMRHGISQWKARRWIATAHALETLPDLSRAFASGELGIDKVVELARFATFESEAGLIAWARLVSCWAIRQRADLEVRRSLEDVRETERADSSRGGTWTMAGASGWKPSCPAPRERSSLEPFSAPSKPSP